MLCTQVGKASLKGLIVTEAHGRLFLLVRAWRAHFSEAACHTDVSFLSGLRGGLEPVTLVVKPGIPVHGELRYVTGTRTCRFLQPVLHFQAAIFFSFEII